MFGLINRWVKNVTDNHTLTGKYGGLQNCNNIAIFITGLFLVISHRNAV